MTIITSNHDYRQSRNGRLLCFQIGGKGIKKWFTDSKTFCKSARGLSRNSEGEKLKKP
jgi:hypothetical protein